MPISTIPTVRTVTGEPSSSFARPADTTAYASGDLVANSTTAGSVTPLSFTVAATSGAAAMIRRARLSKTGTSTTNASFRLHLYSSSPTLANGDNGAWSTSEYDGYLGYIDIVADQAFTDGASGVSGVEEINTGTVTVYGLLEALAAYTPSSGETFAVTLEVVRG